MNRNNKIILHYLLQNDTATLEEIYKNQPTSYYHNWQKYMSERMSKLVKAGYVVRVKKGVFKLSTLMPKVNLSNKLEITKHLNLFNSNE
jgi:hypothetical protein